MINLEVVKAYADYPNHLKVASEEATGVLRTGSVWKAKGNTQQNLFIVTSTMLHRKAKGYHVPLGYTHVIQLAPPVELFRKVLDWKAKGIAPSSWWEEYTQDYLKHLLEDPGAGHWLRIIMSHLIEGFDVQADCYCGKPEYCHRGILAWLFEAYGYKTDIK